MKLIYVIGDGRSGSTIFSILMGNHPDIESVGELYRWIEFNGYPKKGNTKAEDHIFWENVRAQYIKNSENTDFALLAEGRDEIENYAQFLKVYFKKSHPQRTRLYQDYLEKLFGAVCRVSGKPVIMDASRNMGRAALIADLFPQQVWMIHLVRDPRGVVLSYKKKNIEQDYKPPYKAALHNTLKNIFALMVGTQMPPERFITIRYEDVVEKPAATLEQLGSFLEMDFQPLIAQIQNGTPLNVPHILDGNRIRNVETISLRSDQAWKSKLGRFHKFLTVLLTFPFFIRFKYYKNK